MKHLSKRTGKDQSYKTCGCGARYSKEDWQSLPYRYIWDLRKEVPEEERNDPSLLLEYRDCIADTVRGGKQEKCNSTIGVPVSPEHAEKQIKIHGK